MDTNGWAESADTADGGSADFSAVRQNAKLILRADLTLETQNFDAASADLEKLTAETGGYIESSSLSGDKGSRSAYYTLRIPQEKFETFYAQLGDRAHVVYSSRSSEDITEQYTDIETRLATLQTKHERLLALLDQAGKMEDIISLENALADCEYEIGSESQLDGRPYLDGFYTMVKYIWPIPPKCDMIKSFRREQETEKTMKRWKGAAFAAHNCRCGAAGLAQPERECPCAGARHCHHGGRG